MQFGAHVSAAGGPLRALERGARLGAEVVQLHTQSPRAWRPSGFSEETLARYRSAQAAAPTVRVTLCHASYLINLATSDSELLAKSQGCLRENLRVASGLGAAGLVLHLGSHRGIGLAAVVQQLGAELVRALDTVEGSLAAPCCPILLENAAGAGGTCGRSFSELGAVIAAAADDPRLGICLDTQHLFASGAAYRTLEGAERVVAGIEAHVGLHRLYCIHLNDSKVPRGSNVDRHANLGEGLIGRTALAALLGHPRLQELPAVLEVPGADNSGPRSEDLATARRLHAEGIRRWQRAAGFPITVAGAPASPTRPPPPAPRRASGGRTGSRRDRSPAGSP